MRKKKNKKKKQNQNANEFLTDLVISTFSVLLGGLDATEDPREMEELSKDNLLKRDVDSIISTITPYLPYIDLLSGGVTVGKHVSKHMLNKLTEEPKPESSENEQ